VVPITSSPSRSGELGLVTRAGAEAGVAEVHAVTAMQNAHSATPNTTD
jgi:hypothetical protein